MFSGRGEVPWHGIGEVLDGVLTSDEAIKEFLEDELVKKGGRHAA
jgi:hypothetical protein